AHRPRAGRDRDRRARPGARRTARRHVGCDLGRLCEHPHPAIDRTLASAGADAARPAVVTAALRDLDDFADRVRRGVFDLRGDGPVFVSRAPGRLDVMGGIADYSGSLVLQWPIREATRVALRPWSERRVAIISIGQNGLERRCAVPLDLVGDPRRPYADVRAWFAADPTRHWAAYVAGVFHVLSREHGVSFPGGAAIFVESDVPDGNGVS